MKNKNGSFEPHNQIEKYNNTLLTLVLLSVRASSRVTSQAEKVNELFLIAHLYCFLSIKCYPQVTVFIVALYLRLCYIYSVVKLLNYK